MKKEGIESLFVGAKTWKIVKCFSKHMPTRMKGAFVQSNSEHWGRSCEEAQERKKKNLGLAAVKVENLPHNRHES